MTIQQLHYAMALLQHQSFNRAAKDLQISQPALSVQIKKLENELGTILFDRSNKVITATHKGQILLDKAQLIINESQQLAQLATQLNDTSAGELRVGMIPTLAPYLVPLFIDQLTADYPAMQLDVIELLTEDILLQLRTGAIDCGVVSTPIKSSLDLVVRPLFYEEIKLYISPHHPLSTTAAVCLQEIDRDDIWLLKEGNCFRDQVDNMCDIGKRKSSRWSFDYESNNIEALCRIVEYQGGLTFMPELTSLHLSDSQSDMVKVIKGRKKVREISMLSLQQHIKIQDIDLLAETIRRNVPSSMLVSTDTEIIDTNVHA